MDRSIPLTQGKTAIIDAADALLVTNYQWCAKKDRNTFYAITKIRRDGKRTTLYMHRLLLDAKKGQQVDHCDGDGLNNRRSNLRLATNQQNGGNKRRQSRSTTSKFKGVSYHRRDKRWFAYIGKSNTWLGYFDTEQEAAEAYNVAAIERYGEFARLNEWNS